MDLNNYALRVFRDPLPKPCLSIIKQESVIANEVYDSLMCFLTSSSLALPPSSCAEWCLLKFSPMTVMQPCHIPCTNTSSFNLIKCPVQNMIGGQTLSVLFRDSSQICYCYVNQLKVRLAVRLSKCYHPMDSCCANRLCCGV